MRENSREKRGGKSRGWHREDETERRGKETKRGNDAGGYERSQKVKQDN